MQHIDRDDPHLAVSYKGSPPGRKFVQVRAISDCLFLRPLSIMESFTTPQGLALLEDNKDAYREARGRDRKNVVLSVYRQLVLLTRVRGQPNKKKLKKVSPCSRTSTDC